MTPQPPVAAGWQFALAVLSEWRRTFAVMIIVMLLGWPAVVIKNWAQDMGYAQSLGIGEQADREAEHARQDKVHTTISRGIIQQASISQAILEELKSHNTGASQDRQMLGYFTWKQCIQDNGKNATICKQFQRMGDGHGH